MISQRCVSKPALKPPLNPPWQFRDVLRVSISATAPAVTKAASTPKTISRRNQPTKDGFIVMVFAGDMPNLPSRGSLSRSQPVTRAARLRDLGVSELRSRWHTVFERQPPPHLRPAICCFASWPTSCRPISWVTLDAETVRLLYRSGSPENLAVVKGMAVQNGGLWVQSPELELRDFPGDTPNRLRKARAKELSES
jgi:hypothetical protein